MTRRSFALPINRYQTDNQFVYNLSSNLGSRHFIKIGTDIRRQQLDDNADNFSRGFYNFGVMCGGTTYSSSYAAFLAGCVTTFQKGYGPFFLENRVNESNFYAEDNWKVRPNLTLYVGARYEYVSAPKEVEGRIQYSFGDDKNNIEPRIGFAYSPDWSEGWLGKLAGGGGQSSIRGGYGIYHGRIFQSVFSQSGATVRFNPPNALFLNVSNSTNLADPTNGFVFAPGPQTVRHAEAFIDPNLEMPYTQQWNLSVERKLPWRSALRVSYTGNRGIGLLKYELDNLPLSPSLCPVPVSIGPNEISVRLPRTNERRPNGNFTSNTVASNGAWSYYHGLQVEWNKEYAQGLTFQMSYTWSKAIDTTSEATFVGSGDSNILGPDPRVSRGLSRFHSPHRFTFFGTYELPWYKERNDFAGQLLGGWKVSMVAKFAAGTPFTVVNSNGFGDLNFDGFTEQRPALVDPGVLGGHFTVPDQAPFRLPREAFRAPTISDSGCCVLGRNTFYGDGVDNFDFSFFKSFKMPFEGHSLILRADLFNAFNHVQYGLPILDLANANFGRLTGTSVSYSPRNVQISLRYVF